MNAITQLLSDHEPLSEGVRQLRGLIQRLVQEEARGGGSQAELMETIEQLRDELFEHFGMEEEVLFPFLQSEVPALALTVARLEADHDQLCGALLRIEQLSSGGELTSAPLRDRLRHVFERFEVTYRSHAAAEAELLAVVEVQLQPDQLVRLGDLMRGLR